MYCQKCGKEVADDLQVCSNCGGKMMPVPSKPPSPDPKQSFTPKKEPGIGALGIVCFLFPIVGLVLFLIWRQTQRGKANGAGVTALVGFVFFTALLVGVAVPTYKRYVERSRSSEAQVAISSIRQRYRLHSREYGYSRDYTLERAIDDADLGPHTLKNWTFEALGSPPRIFIATSTEDFAGGSGLQVWYDVDDERFHGYGLDKLPAPEEVYENQSSELKNQGAAAARDQTPPSHTRERSLAPQDQAAIVAVVNDWTQAHNEKDLRLFSSLYADQVVFYTESYSRAQCLKAKQRLLTVTYPSFHQENQKISLRNLGAGRVRAEFIKVVHYSNQSDSYEAYLVLEKQGNDWRIIKESDLTTERNLGLR